MSAIRTPATSGVIKAAGADLYFERRGEGPPLLLIVGGGGDCGFYAALAGILAGEYTVLTYDRRGNSRSTLRNGNARIQIADQSADAVAVLHANGFASARIFGNSGGATIALDLAAHCPQVVEAVVCHEPPVPAVLPDAVEYRAIFDDIDRILQTQGWRAAFTLFQTKVVSASPGSVAVLLDPPKVLAPSRLLERMQRVSNNWEYMMRYEVRSFIDYEPDLDRIAANHVRIAVAYGAATQDATAIRMSIAAAELLGAESVAFPGGHTAPTEIPGRFAEKLRSLLQRL